MNQLNPTEGPKVISLIQFVWEDFGVSTFSGFSSAVANAENGMQTFRRRAQPRVAGTCWDVTHELRSLQRLGPCEEDCEEIRSRWSS